MLTQDRINLIFIFSGRVLQAAIAILTIKAMTFSLSSSEVGHQYLLSTIVMWFSLVLINPVGMYINRHLHEWRESKQIYRFISEVNKYFFLVALVSIVIGIAVKLQFSLVEQIENWKFVLFVFCYVYFSTWFQTLISFFNLFEFQKIFVVLNVLNQIIGLLVAFVLSHYISASAIAWMSGLLISQVIILFVGAYCFRKLLPVSTQNSEIKDSLIFKKTTLLFCIPVACTTLFMWFNTQGYRLIVEKQIGVEQLGILALGLSIATSLAGIVEAIVTQYFYPSYYKNISSQNIDSRRLSWANLFKSTTVVYIPFCFLSFANASFAIKVLTNEKFYSAYLFLGLGAFIEFFRQSSNIAYLVSHAEKKTHYSILPYALGALVLLIGATAIKWMDIFSVQNFVLLLLTVSVIVFLMNLYQVHRLIGLEYPYKVTAFSLLISIPMSIGFFMLNTGSSLYILASFAVLSLLWCSACVYLGLKFK